MIKEIEGERNIQLLSCIMDRRVTDYELYLFGKALIEIRVSAFMKNGVVAIRSVCVGGINFLLTFDGNNYISVPWWCSGVPAL